MGDGMWRQRLGALVAPGDPVKAASVERTIAARLGPGAVMCKVKRPESVDEYKAEISGYLDAFARELPKQIDAPAISRIKLPGNAVWCRETMLWRFTELAQDALERLSHKRIASAILLTRAAVETGAALWYLDVKIKRAIETSDVAELDQKLKQLVVGYKDPSALADGLPQAINVLTFVGQVDKEIGGYASQYAALCEYSHPNHDGTAGLYSHPHEDTGLIDLGSNVRGAKSHEMICALNLSVAVMMFSHSYAAIGESLPQLVELCEKARPPRP